MSLVLLLALGVAALLAAFTLPTRRSGGRASRETAGDNTVPERLDLKAKQYFFTRSESAFFQALEAALPQGYRVFPNVRLNDVFLIPKGEGSRATYARLRDKHVDFLIVALPDYRPVLAIELDGDSHAAERQQYRDAVKDVAFRSGGLKLVRVPTDEQHSAESLRPLLAQNGIAPSRLTP